MKKIFAILGLAAALVSCAKEDIVRIDRQEIAFGNTFVDNATRADYSTGSLAEFYVYGTVTGTAGTVNIFDGDKVTKTQQNTTDIGDTGTWWYAAADAQYWIPKASYSFAAVVDATVGTNDTANGMPVTLTTQADNAMNLKDMLYATATAVSNRVHGSCVAWHADTLFCLPLAAARVSRSLGRKIRGVYASAPGHSR